MEARVKPPRKFFVCGCPCCAVPTAPLDLMTEIRSMSTTWRCRLCKVLFTVHEEPQDTARS